MWRLTNKSLWRQLDCPSLIGQAQITLLVMNPVGAQQNGRVQESAQLTLLLTVADRVMACVNLLPHPRWRAQEPTGAQIQLRNSTGALAMLVLDTVAGRRHMHIGCRTVLGNQYL
jgi:hypothetical protein